jgi:hypothetical protein
LEQNIRLQKESSQGHNPIRDIEEKKIGKEVLLLGRKKTILRFSEGKMGEQQSQPDN